MPAKILVADDDTALQRLISSALKLEQHEVVQAEDGQQALDLIRSEKPDLVILDVMMPIINGFDVCVALRSDPATALLPVIMLSGLAQVQEKITGLRAGADEYLTKPVDLRELLTRVEMLLVRHKLLRRSPTARAGHIYSVIGAKGGVGVTTLAVNLAAQLKRDDNAVALLEFRPDFGTVAVQLNLRPGPTLADLREEEAVAITEQVVSRLLIDTPAGVRVLCGPQRASDFGQCSAALGGALLARLVALADFVVVDLPPAADSATEAIIRGSEEVIVVLEPEAACVAATVQRLAQIEGYSSNIVTHVVANNRQGAMLLSTREIEARLGRALTSVISPATDIIGVAVQYGTPLVIFQPGHAFAEQMQEIAQIVQDAKTVTQL